MRRKLFEMALPCVASRSATAPLICFVHVPKAAGSSVNSHLRDWSWRGLDHVERFAHKADIACRRVRRCDWISGHLSYEKLDAFLDVTAPDRQKKLIGIMRDPVGQVAAHYNWQIEIYHRGQRFFDAHPQAIRDLSDRIRSTDHATPDQIISTLSSAPALFANLQSRFLLGNEIDLSGPKAAARFRTYTTLQRTEALPQLIKIATGVRPNTVAQSNISRWHFDRAVFQSPAILEFLRHFNGHDETLYDQIGTS